MEVKIKHNLMRLIMTVVCVTMVVLSCLFLNNLHRIATIICIIVFASLGVLIPSIKNKHEWLLKLLVVIAAFCSIILVAYIILDQTGFLYKIQADSIKHFIEKTKEWKWGILIFFFITLLQVVILPIPAAVTIVAGTAIYGPWVSFAVSSIGTIIGSIISFALGKSFGKRIVIWMFGPEKTQKYTDFLTRGKFVFIFMMIFPFFPDDLICMLAGITNMTYKYFIITVSITRTIVVAFYSFFGTGDIIPFKGWGIPVWIAIFAAFIIAYVVVTIINKNKKGALIKKKKDKKIFKNSSIK